MIIATVTALATPPVAGDKVAAGYLLLNPTDGPAKLAALVSSAATLPINRVVLSFVAPTMVYLPGSNTLQYSDIGYSNTGDYGFSAVKTAVAQLQAGGVEVFLSMGGWNFNCFPYFYAKYSIGSFSTGPNYWKIQQYGGGSAAGCNESNMWCYTCESETANTTLSDFVVFPEPAQTDTWKAAQAQVVQGAKGNAVQWHPEMLNGAQVKDPVDGTGVIVPGSGYWAQQNRDPYADFVYLAKDLGLDGVDLDYEEIWHADTFRNGTGTGPFTLDQTVYKYSAIAYDIMNVIKSAYPSCKLSTAAGAAGAWSSKWWGGNLKGLWYFSNLWFPDVVAFMATGANAGGINVMSYDLSSNNQYYECPATTSDCDLAGQVKFYMDTYAAAGIPARVGYEVGQPAYPDATIDAVHQLPLTQTDLSSILQAVPSCATNGGFFWELFKSQNSAPTGSAGQPNNIDASRLAQQVCAAILPGAARCNGVIPSLSRSATLATSPPTTTVAVAITTLLSSSIASPSTSHSPGMVAPIPPAVSAPIQAAPAAPLPSIPTSNILLGPTPLRPLSNIPPATASGSTPNFLPPQTDDCEEEPDASEDCTEEDDSSEDCDEENDSNEDCDEETEPADDDCLDGTAV
ncbi:hypothetical protein HDU98_008226 [Podochytrium sp. JEL0797]|nr:hypothetical protein HDU98_008226 [Podochytrium sp. JEL0797]